MSYCLTSSVPVFLCRMLPFIGHTPYPSPPPMPGSAFEMETQLLEYRDINKCYIAKKGSMVNSVWAVTG